MPDLLVLDTHPRAGSFGAAVADHYARAAAAAGARVERLCLRELSFDPVLRAGYTAPQPLEPDLERAQARIAEARHLAVQFPVWWGGAPALLKGFVDRVFLPGFAFRYREGGRVEKLLAGRSARLLITQDWPTWANELVLGAPARRAMKTATLGFVGYAPVRVTELGPVHGSTDAQRAAWLARAEAAGRTDARALVAATGDTPDGRASRAPASAGQPGLLTARPS